MNAKTRAAKHVLMGRKAQDDDFYYPPNRVTAGNYYFELDMHDPAAGKLEYNCPIVVNEAWVEMWLSLDLETGSTSRRFNVDWRRLGSGAMTGSQFDAMLKNLAKVYENTSDADKIWEDFTVRVAPSLVKAYRDWNKETI